MALASNLRSRDGGSKVFMMRLGKDFDKVFLALFLARKTQFVFDKVDGDAALRPKKRGCAPQRNEKGMFHWSF